MASRGVADVGYEEGTVSIRFPFKFSICGEFHITMMLSEGCREPGPDRLLIGHSSWLLGRLTRMQRATFEPDKLTHAVERLAEFSGCRKRCIDGTNDELNGSALHSASQLASARDTVVFGIRCPPEGRQFPFTVHVGPAVYRLSRRRRATAGERTSYAESRAFRDNAQPT